MTRQTLRPVAGSARAWLVLVLGVSAKPFTIDAALRVPGGQATTDRLPLTVQMGDKRFGRMRVTRVSSVPGRPVWRPSIRAAFSRCSMRAA